MMRAGFIKRVWSEQRLMREGRSVFFLFLIVISILFTLMGFAQEEIRWPPGSELIASDISRTSLTLEWEPIRDEMGDITYQILVTWPFGETPHPVQAGVPTFHVTGLTPEETYRFTVYACMGEDLPLSDCTEGPSTQPITMPPPCAVSLSDEVCVIPPNSGGLAVWGIIVTIVGTAVAVITTRRRRGRQKR